MASTSGARALVALGKFGWTASGSPTDPSTPAANALDDNPATGWSTGTAQVANQYFQVDFGSARSFAELIMDTSQNPSDYPRTFQVNVSDDGSNWGNPIASGTGTTPIVALSFQAQFSRFVRVTLLGSAAANWSIQEFNLFSSALPRTGWTATATSAANLASQALDDAYGSVWTSAGAQTGQSFTVDMQARQLFNQIVLYSSGFTNDYPRSYLVFVSNDGTTWGAAVTTGTASASPVIINLPNQMARFVRITAGTDPHQWTIADLKVSGQPTTQTKLPRSGWTATAPSSNGTNLPAGALDGRSSTRWTSGAGQTGQVFTVDMLTLRTFNQITVDAGTTSGNYPRGYAVSVSSDGATFGPDLASGTGAALTTINLPVQTARYIKIRQTVANTTTDSTPWSIQELNVLGPALARDGWLATASSKGGADVPSNAIDGNNNTRWTTESAQTGQLIRVDMGIAQTFNQVTVEAGSNLSNVPQAYAVEVSNDDTTWSSVATGAGSATVTANFLTQTARYLRVRQTGSSTNPWSVQELNLWRLEQPCDTGCNSASRCQTVTSCDPSSGVCTDSAPAADWTLCSDGNAWNGLETCQGGVCTPEQPGAATTCAPGTKITFYQSFNDPDTTADIGVSGNTAVGNTFALTTGLFGTALDQSVDNAIHYDTYSQAANPGNITLTKPGSVSMWIKPNGGQAVYFLAFTGDVFAGLGGRKLFVFDYFMYGGLGVGATLEDGSGKLAQAFVNAPGSNWRSDGQWHLLVVNWGWDSLEISVDGTWSSVTHASWLRIPAGAWTGGISSLYPGPYWPGSGGGSRKDELMVLNRPMTHDEVAWYYGQRNAGGPTNPAVLRFTNDSTSCNAWDDLNPCTTDACTAAGETHTGLATGTVCGAATACKNADTCTATATCQAGSFRNVVADTNVCTLDICDAAGVVVHPAGPDGTACDDQNVCTLGESCQAGQCKTGPGTACVTGDSVTLYVSYEHGYDADISGGPKTPNTHLPFVGRPGLFGQAIDSQSQSDVGYFDETGMTVNLTRPGSLSFWVQTEDGQLPSGPIIDDSYAHIRLQVINYLQGIGILLANGGRVTPGTDWTVGVAASPLPPFNDGAWHLVVVNWTPSTMGVSVDGGVLTSGPIDWMSFSHRFGPPGAGVIWAGGNNFGTGPGFFGAVDEIILLSRTMTDAEIRWYWAQRLTGGPGVTNPAVTHFNATPTACNSWDDLNPCTADACDAGGGITHAKVADGTSCSNGNACDGAETCQAGSCTPGPALTCTDACHQPGTCDAVAGCSQGAPIDKVGCNINLRMDGVVDMGGGNLVAIFGHNSSATAPFHPTTNTVTVDGMPANPQPPPPATLAIGINPGTFRPTFTAGQTIAWTVDGQTKTASGSSTRLTPTTFGTSGKELVIEGVRIVVQADGAAFPTTPAPLPSAQEPSNAGNFPGALTGNFSVTPTGAATYTVPIELPPGVGGMVPALSLVYNSQGGDGLAGQGWELGGLSTIHRCPKTRAQDGYARPVMMDALGSPDEHNEDGICLDGVRLFRRNGYYEAESKDFSVITLKSDAVNGGDHFVVQTKGGQKRYYGLDPTNRVQGPLEGPDGPVADSSAPVQTAAWLLDRVMDEWGNYYDLKYNNDGGPTDFIANGVRVSQIDYTGHAITPAEAPFYSVYFDYEDRPDIRRIRFRDLVIRKNARLKSIRTPRGKYYLTYRAAPTSIDALMLPSLLGQISYCAASGVNPSTGVCNTPVSQQVKPLVFAWDGGDYHWEPTSSYTIPTSIDTQSGAQFIDLDGDGRQDLVKALQGAPRSAWKNAGEPVGWKSAPEWTLPVDLLASDTKTPLALLVDMDGDRLPDLIAKQANHDVEECTGSGDLRVCNLVSKSFEPAVFLNRLKNGGGWQFSASLSTSKPVNAIDPNQGFEHLYLSPHDPNAQFWQHPVDWFWENGDMPAISDFILDVDGDGAADWVRINPLYTSMMVMLNIRSSTTSSDRVWSLQPIAPFGPSIYDLHPPGMSPQQLKHYYLEDVNDDGLPDFVQRVPPDSGNPPASLKVAINTNYPLADNSTVWRWSSVSHDLLLNPSSRSYITDLTPVYRGDIDGDGNGDRLFYNSRPLGASFATGYGFASTDIVTSTDPSTISDLHLRALSRFPIPYMSGYDTDLIDFNADGLADFVEEHYMGRGQLLINTGDEFVDLFGQTQWQDSIPELSVPIGVSWLKSNRAFLDLNGDGVVDVGTTTGAYLNRFKPPVINGFPSGVAANTDVSYSVITTAEAQLTGDNGDPAIYSDAATLDPGTTFLAAPLRVVSQTSADNGVGSKLPTKYRYSDLRASAYGRGPQGFGHVIVIGPGDPVTGAEGTTWDTKYAQAFPYTGRALSVEARNQGLLSKTVTTFCDTPDGSNCTGPQGSPFGGGVGISRFVRVSRVDFTAYLRTSTLPEPTASEQIVTTTTNVYDSQGNPKLVTVESKSNAAGGDYQIETKTTFGDPGSSEERIGKATQVVVTSSRLDDASSPTVVHTTAYVYLHTTFADPFDSTPVERVELVKELIEPGAGSENGIEQHTAYAHDTFGNLTKTTVCADNFSVCIAGSLSQSATPFRTTIVSYDPSEFHPETGGVPPLVGTLAYATPGRFPVRKQVYTGPLAGLIVFTSYSAYDPLFGTLLQQTDANGNHVVFTYDDVGREKSRTEFYGTSAARTTTTDRFWAAGDVSRAVLVGRTQPPSGATNWTYTDALGRTVLTRSRSYEGGLSQVQTDYDTLGRVHRVSKPFLVSETPLWSTTTYDFLNRVKQVDDDLGRVDGSQASLVSGTTTVYGGSLVATTQTVNGLPRSRAETKNALGKVSLILDSEGQQMSYTYDAAGNLIQTDDHAGHLVKIHYDTRGRRDQTIDPDLGTWSYGYDGFGDLTEQVDAMARRTTMTYDQLGRMRTKTDPANETAEWVYDISPVGPAKGKLAAVITAPDPHLAGPCNIPGTTYTEGNRSGKYFYYSTGGDIQDAFECVDGSTFQVSYEYNSVGQRTRITYPTVNDARFSVTNHYTSAGFLQYVADGNGAVLWKASSRNAAGQVTDETLGNGVETLSDRSAGTGWLLGSRSVALALGQIGVQQWSYRYDEVGNLRYRQRATDATGGSASETFEYDLLDRVTSSRVVGLPSYDVREDFSYDAAGIGNLVQKKGKTYTYGTCNAGPHAVCQVGGDSPFQYDANGNMLGNADRTMTYDFANRVVGIDSHPQTSRGNDVGVVGFIYDAAGNRVAETLGSAASGTQKRTVYVGLGENGRSLYERTSTPGADTEHVHFIYAGDVNSIAVRLVKVGSTSSSSPVMRYNLFDHLGSITAVGDETGRVVTAAEGGSDAGEMGYDPWGARRNPDGTAAEAASFSLPIGRRGFTGHETIPNVGLVNMNGRVYDPSLGRFLTPDPHIQFLANRQSFNRYSYALNNPLRYTDPTGYFVSHGFDILVGVVMGAGVAACGPYAGACAMGALVGYAVYSAASSHYSHGVPWGQSIGMAYMGFAIGLMTGQAGAALASVGVSTTTIVVGSVALGGVVNTVLSGGGWGGLGQNMLLGAATSAISYAISSALGGPEVSKRDQEAAQKDDGGGASEAFASKKGNPPVICGEQGSPACGVWNGSERSPEQLRRDVALARAFLGPEKGGPNIRYRTQYTGNEFAFALGETSDKTIVRSELATNDSPSYVDVPPAPRGSKLIMDGHTHPPGSLFNEYFSTYDIAGRIQRGLLTPGRNLLLYDPTVGTRGTITVIPWQLFMFQAPTIP